MLCSLNLAAVVAPALHLLPTQTCDCAAGAAWIPLSWHLPRRRRGGRAGPPLLAARLHARRPAQGPPGSLQTLTLTLILSLIPTLTLTLTYLVPTLLQRSVTVAKLWWGEPANNRTYP